MTRGRACSRRITTAAAFVLALVPARAAWGFTPAGHKVLEVMAYRELGEGPEADAEALAYLMRDGEIEPALCMNDGTGDCRDRRETDPLAWWPVPRTDTPDMILARQFSHVGQCFHFMAQRDDESTDHYGNPSDPNDPHVSYALQWTAYDRCVTQLEGILADIVVDARGGPRAARQNARGMYELMHAVMDSYSMAHTERDYADRVPGGDPKIRYLKVWQPTVVNPLSDESLHSRHAIFEPRDDDFIDRFAVVDGRPCTDYVSRPYQMPAACLSETGRLAVDALKDLVHVVVWLRVEPQRAAYLHAIWQQFVSKHLAHASRPLPGRRGAPTEYEEIPFAFLGARVQSTLGRDGHVDTTIAGRYILHSGRFDPLTLAASFEVGTRESPGQPNRLLLREDVDLALPLGDRVGLAMTPLSIASTTPYHGAPQGLVSSGMEVASRAVRLDFFEPFGLRRVSFSLWGPVEYSWLDDEFRWSLGAGVWGTLDEHRPGAADRHASEPDPHAALGPWPHPHPWDSELRKPATWWPQPGVYLGATSGSSGIGYGPGGKVEEGIELGFLRRNPWGEPRPLSGSVLLGAIALPNTGASRGLHTALAGAIAARVKAIGPIALTAEAGVGSPDLAPSSAFGTSFQVRGGAALSVGGIDLVVLSPTWPPSDFSAGEILTTRIVIEP